MYKLLNIVWFLIEGFVIAYILTSIILSFSKLDVYIEDMLTMTEGDRLILELLTLVVIYIRRFEPLIFK